MKILMYIIILMLFLSSGFVSASVSVLPETQNFEFIAGDSVDSEVIVTNNDGEDIIGFIVTEVEPEGKGITVTYSANPDPFVSYPIFRINTHDTIIFNMLIETDMNLAPGTYAITTTFMKVDGEHTTSVEYVYRTVAKTVTVEDTERIDELLALIADLENTIDDLQDSNSTNNELIDSLQGIIKTLQNQIDDLLNKDDSTDLKEEDNNVLYALILIIVALLLMFLYLFFRFSKLKERNKKGK